MVSNFEFSLRDVGAHGSPHVIRYMMDKAMRSPTNLLVPAIGAKNEENVAAILELKYLEEDVDDGFFDYLDAESSGWFEETFKDDRNYIHMFADIIGAP